MISRLCLFVFLLSTHLVKGQDEDYAIKKYSITDGLPQSQVTALAEDELGYLWVGTFGGGVARFDGRKFFNLNTQHGLLSNYVTDVQVDKNNHLWFAHPTGLSFYDGRSFTNVKVPDVDGNGRRVHIVKEYNDTIYYIGTPDVIGKIVNGLPVPVLSKEISMRGFLSIHACPNDVLIMQRDTSLLYFDGHELKKMKDKRLGLFAFFVKGSGEHLIALKNGMVKFDAVKFSLEAADHSWPRTPRFYDSATNTFWATDRQSLIRQSTGVDGSVSEKVVMSNVQVNDLLFDSENNTWISTAGGLLKYSLQPLRKIGTDSLNVIMSVSMDADSTIYAGSLGKGFIRIKDKERKWFFNREFQGRNHVFCFYQSRDGMMWIGTAGGLAKFDPQSEKLEWINRYYTYAIQQDRNGRIIAGTIGRGLLVLDHDSTQWIEMPRGYAFAYDSVKDVLWVSNGERLSVVEKDKVDKIEIPEARNTYIISMRIYRDSLLLLGAFGSGLSIYNNETREFIKTLTVKDGMQSDFIYFIALDGDYIWLGSQSGMSRIKLDKDLGLAEAVFFDQDDGLREPEANQNAYFIGKKKLFGFVGDLYLYDPPAVTNANIFPIHISRVEITYADEKSKEFRSQNIYPQGRDAEGKFPHFKNDFTFYFNRVDKHNPKAVRFRYFLRSFDKKWSSPSDETNVRYSNLPPGKYVFQVQSSGGDGTWMEPTSFLFEIEPPFYKTTAFLILAAMGAVLLILFIVYQYLLWKMKAAFRLMKIREQEQANLRRELASDFHDEMGNYLAMIIQYSGLLKIGQPPEHQNKLYDKIEKVSQQLYSETRDFVWSIDPSNNSIMKVYEVLRAFAEKLFGGNIPVNSSVRIDSDHRLSYLAVRDLILIGKETFTNILKHANATETTLAISEDDEQYFLSIIDNGKGFAEKDATGSGLKNMRKRARRSGADIEITSSSSGTSVRIIIPKKEKAAVRMATKGGFKSLFDRLISVKQ